MPLEKTASAALVLVLALVAAPPAAGQEQIAVRQGGDPEEEVAAVVRAFHDALAAGDSTAALGHLHPDVVVYEDGHAETLEEYRSGHLAADMGASDAVQRETLGHDVVVYDEAALSTRLEAASGTIGEREIEGRLTETMLLVPTDEGWKIRHVHWSSRRLEE